MTNADKVTRCKRDKNRLGIAKNNQIVQQALLDSSVMRGMTEKITTTVTERFTLPLTGAISPEERVTSERTSEDANKCTSEDANKCTSEQDYQSISFSTDFFEAVQSLHDKNVRLKAWIDLCHEVFESCLDSDLSRVSKKPETESEALQTKIRAILDKQDSDWDLSRCKSYADVVMANFLEFCWQVRLKKHVKRPSRPIAFSKLGPFFDEKTLDKFGELMSKDVRIDLWFELCAQAYTCFWEKEDPKTLSKKEKEGVFDKISQLVAKKDGGFWPMSSHRLAQFLFSYLPAEPLNGTPKRRKVPT